MPSRGMPAFSSRDRTCGSTCRLGAGRVMSQTEIAALNFPRASSMRAGEPMGWSSAILQGCGRIRQRGGRTGLQNAVVEALPASRWAGRFSRMPDGVA